MFHHCVPLSLQLLRLWKANPVQHVYRFLLAGEVLHGVQLRLLLQLEEAVDGVFDVGIETAGWGREGRGGGAHCFLLS